ncbi:MAG: DUF1116 domain-containing protein [Carbonactinosporaceae bacterium]
MVHTEPPLYGLLAREPGVVAAGADLFADALAAQAAAVTPVDWRPPLEGTGNALPRVLADRRREQANRRAVDRLLGTAPWLVDVRPARDALGLRSGSFLHAGPPLAWERASGPMRGALVGAMLVEGLADSPEQAEARLRAGSGITLDPCHHHRAVGPMAGVISPSMWVFELEDRTGGARAWCPLNEGLGKVLRYGAYGPEVIERLRWMSAVLGPVLQRALRRRGPVDVRALIAQALQMGDEGHNRNRAGTSLFLREIAADVVESGASTTEVGEVLRFVGGNDHFFLNLVMPACKLAADAARDVPGSTLVVAMARNGTDFGIQVSGTGDRWFTGPAGVPDGLFLGSYGPADANPDIGDSTITETAGIGGFAMAASPAIVTFVGGQVDDALAATQAMYEITLAEHPAYQVPVLGFRGTPTGIDVTRVARTGVLPQINTGIAGRVAGTGQVGAGLVNPPAEVFVTAIQALAESAPAM